MSMPVPYPLQLEFERGSPHHPLAPARAVAPRRPALDDRLGAAHTSPGADPDQLLHGLVHGADTATDLRRHRHDLPLRVAGDQLRARFCTRTTRHSTSISPPDDDGVEPHTSVRLARPEHLNRWKPLYKWFLAIPQYVVVTGLLIGAVLAVIAGLFGVLFTGEYPLGIRDFLVKAYRYTLRGSRPTSASSPMSTRPSGWRRDDAPASIDLTTRGGTMKTATNDRSPAPTPASAETMRAIVQDHYGTVPEEVLRAWPRRPGRASGTARSSCTCEPPAWTAVRGTS